MPQIGPQTKSLTCRLRQLGIVLATFALAVACIWPIRPSAAERQGWLELERLNNQQRLDLNRAQREMLERSKRESTNSRWATQRRVQKQRLDQRFLQERQLRKQRLIEHGRDSESLFPPAPRPSTQLQRSKTEQRQQQLQFKMQRRAREALPSGKASQPAGSLRFERKLLPADRGLKH